MECIIENIKRKWWLIWPVVLVKWVYIVTISLAGLFFFFQKKNRSLMIYFAWRKSQVYSFLSADKLPLRYIYMIWEGGIAAIINQKSLAVKSPKALTYLQLSDSENWDESWNISPVNKFLLCTAQDGRHNASWSYFPHNTSMTEEMVWEKMTGWKSQSPRNPSLLFSSPVP